MSLGNVKYLAVCRSADSVVIASYVGSNKSYLGEFNNVISKTMQSPSSQKPRLMINYQSLFTCFFQRQGSCHFFVMTSPTYNRTYAYQLLETMSQQFLSQYGNAINTCKPDGLTRSASQMFRSITEGYDDPTNIDKIARIQKLTDETKGIMADNINKIIVNNSNVEQLETMAEILNDDANDFHSNATTIKKQARANNRRTKCIIIGVCCAVAVIIIVIVLSVVLTKK